jgi:hypothetical protein
MEKELDDGNPFHHFCLREEEIDVDGCQGKPQFYPPSFIGVKFLVE